MPAIEIGLLRYPESQHAAVLGMTDLLYMGMRAAARLDQTAVTRLRISHWHLPDDVPTPLRSFDSAPDAEARLAVLIVPPSLSAPIEPGPAARWTSWLRAQHAQGVILASVCAGAFLLGETGLLCHRPATTHWVYADRFRHRFPQVRLDIDQLLIDDGDLITAGGVMSWTDLGLRLVARFLGPTVMAETARLMLLDPPGREQRYYSVFAPPLTHGDAAVLKAQHWLQTNHSGDVTLAGLADRAGLEQRTLMRRFQKATGMTTTEYLQHLRVDKARGLLQFGNTPIDRIAWDVGYADPGAFRKIFSRIVGLTPGEYRRRFRTEPTESAQFA